MSIEFEGSALVPNLTKGKGTVRVKSYPAGASPNYLGDQGAEITIGSSCLSMVDFCEVALYVLTNTDLEGESDPRYDLIARLSGLAIAEGKSPEKTNHLTLKEVIMPNCELHGFQSHHKPLGYGIKVMDLAK